MTDEKNIELALRHVIDGFLYSMGSNTSTSISRWCELDVRYQALGTPHNDAEEHECGEHRKEEGPDHIKDAIVELGSAVLSLTFSLTSLHSLEQPR